MNKQTIYTGHIKVPKGVDLQNLATDFLKQHNLDLPLVRVMDSLALLIFHIYVKQKKRVAKGKQRKSSPVPYHVYHRRELVGRHEKEYIPFLVTQGLLKITGQPKKGITSTKFKVTTYAKRWVDHMVTDKVTLKKLNQLHEDQIEVMENLELALMGTMSILKTKPVSFHPDIYKEVDRLKSEALSDALFDNDKQEVEQSFSNLLAELKKLEAGDFSGHRDLKGTRLHTVVTRMYKELRPYIRLHGETTDEIDIKNSQPFFAQGVTDPLFWADLTTQKLHFSMLSPDMMLKLNEPSQYYEEIMHRTGTTKVLSTAKEKKRKLGIWGREIKGDERKRKGCILLLALLVSKEDEPTGLNFLSLVRKGTLYDHLTQNYRGKYFDQDGEDILGSREIAKQTILEELYSDPDKQQFRGQVSILETLFPNFYLFTKILKETGYRNFSLMIQQIEAKVFLEGAVEELLKKYPNIAVLTIHDSIIVPKSKTAEVKAFIEDYIEKVIGWKPVCAVKKGVPLLPFSGVRAEDVYPF